MRGDIRGEWDDTKQHDVLFLLTIRPPDQAELAVLQQDGAELHPAEKFGLAYVRGCEVLEVKDEGALPSPPCLHAHCNGFNHLYAVRDQSNTSFRKTCPL